MKLATLLLFVSACLAHGIAFGHESPPNTVLRVLTYNIHHGEGTDGVVDLNRIARVIRESNADLVALQEVDDSTRRTNQVDQTSQLAELTGLHARFAHQIDFEGGRYGQAILSRYPVSEITVAWLPGTPERERRIAGWANVEIPDLGPVVFATTHLHHNNTGFRKQQAEELVRLFRDKTVPVIIAGDLNAIPDSEPLQTLAATFKSATPVSEDLKTQSLTTTATFPASTPEKQLDYILFRTPDGQSAVTQNVRVLDEAIASDHRPLIAEIVFRIR